MKTSHIFLVTGMLILMTFLTFCGHQKEKELMYSQTKIYIPIIMPLPMTMQYPQVTDLFIKALDTWKACIPIEYHIFNGYFGPPDSLSIQFCDIQREYPTVPEGIIGLFKVENNMVIIDTDDKDNVSEQLFRVMLHELGHSFGMPHIIGKNNTPDQRLDVFKYGCGRNIVLPEESQAEQCIMYPMELGIHREIMPIEIMWVTHFLMHDMNDAFHVQSCTLFDDEDKYKEYLDEQEKERQIK